MVFSIKNLFSSKNKKQKRMNLAEIKTVDEIRAIYGNMEFQWIKGDNMGSIESYKNVTSIGEDYFIEFTSGKRMNINLLDEFLMYYPAPPKQDLGLRAEFTEVTSKPSSVTSIVYSDAYPINQSEESPIYKLLRKQKKNSVEVSIKLKLNLPSKELYSVLSSSFDDAEKDIIDFVLSGVDIEDIKASLADSIRQSYYVSEKKETTKSGKNQLNKKEDDE
jgi:hypothetical protein